MFKIYKEDAFIDIVDPNIAFTDSTYSDSPFDEETIVFGYEEYKPVTSVLIFNWEP